MTNLLPALAAVRGKIKSSWEKVWGQRRVRRGVAAVLFFVLITFLISVEFVPQKVNLVVGQKSSLLIRAPKSVTFEDRKKTAQMRQQAAEAIPDQYDWDLGVKEQVIKSATGIVAQVRQVQEDQTLKTVEARTRKLEEVLPFSLPEEALRSLAVPVPAARQLENQLRILLEESYQQSEGITPEKLEAKKQELNGKIATWNLPSAYRLLAEQVINYSLRPNKFYNSERTRLLREAAMLAVPPVMVTVIEGEEIIRPGEVVTEDHLAKLEALGLSRTPVPWRVVAGSAFLTALLMVIVLCYLYQQCRSIYEQAGHLYLLGLIVVIVLGIGKAVMAINVSAWPEFAAMFGYLVPIATAGMLIAILLDSRLAVLVVAVMSFLLTIMAGFQVRFGLVGLIGGITAVYTVSRLSQRGDLARAGLITSIANVAAILSVGLLTNTEPFLLLTSAVVLGSANGILSSILTNGALPYLESAFGITSSVRLLELSHPSNPLLRRLLTEAPGTYHHSILVGNLAEAAAEAVGGETLLVRVGAYYHDIGKIKRPYFFIENQLAMDNPHEKIAPTLSTLILTSHVRDGVELAREYRLPQPVMDIIAQHHGTSLVSYFYHKAMENGLAEQVSEDEFRYDGPKPRTKEAAIVMLADAVEAAVRSLQNRTPARVEALVKKIIRDKLMDGQLDECDLTFKDLDAIASSFMKVLSGIMHSRIEYPELHREVERSKKSGGARK